MNSVHATINALSAWISAVQPHESWYLAGWIDDSPIEFLVDPGAVVSTLSLKCYEKLVAAGSINIPLTELDLELEAANKSDMKIYGMRSFVRCPLEDIYFIWTFYFLFLLLTAAEILLTAVGMFSPRWECSHRGGNVLTAVGMFSPRWKYFSPGWECSHRGGNVFTAVRMFSPRWECSHRGENVLTAVGMFSPRWKHSHCCEK